VLVRSFQGMINATVIFIQDGLKVFDEIYNSIKNYKLSGKM
jgi:hypothetical protein